MRLRYRMTLEDKARFLDACPHLLDDVQAIDKALGREPKRNWNVVWHRIEDLLHARGSISLEGGRAEPLPQRLHAEGFRSRWRSRRVRARRRSTNPITDLRDFENVPLKDDIDDYFEREVRSARARRLDGPQQGQGRLRDQLQPALLQVHAAPGLWK